MPIIESIAVAAVEVPLDKVTSFATRTVHARHYGLVKVRSVDGAEGIGFCYVGSQARLGFEFDEEVIKKYAGSAAWSTLR